MLLKLRGGRGCGNCSRVARSVYIGQPYRNPSDHPERVDDISVSREEHMDSTSGGILRAYPAAPPPQPVLAPPVHPPPVPPDS